MTEDLKTALITWPRAPYQCGSAQGWMQKAHDRIVELEEALENMMGAFDNPVIRRRMPSDDFTKDCINSGRAALQPKAGS